METEYITTSAGVLFPPICGFVGNLLLHKKDALKSSGTDWLLVLWVFDLTGSLTVNEFAKLIPSVTFRELGSTLFILLTISTIFFWWCVGAYIEPKVRAITADCKHQFRQWGLYLFSHSLAMALTGINIFIFVYRG